MTNDLKKYLEESSHTIPPDQQQDICTIKRSFPRSKPCYYPRPGSISGETMDKEFEKVIQRPCWHEQRRGSTEVTLSRILYGFLCPQ
jgi:hypothetical protein